VRFSVVQDCDNLLCLDISDYPVAPVATASVAVLVPFNPVVVENQENGFAAGNDRRRIAFLTTNPN